MGDLILGTTLQYIVSTSFSCLLLHAQSVGGTDPVPETEP